MRGTVPAGILLLAAAVAVGLAPAAGAQGSRGTGPAQRQEPRSIGVASMLPDGTILLELRAEGAGGLRGEGRFRYPPGHPRYQAVLRHLGGLRPGEAKPVPPWDD